MEYFMVLAISFITMDKDTLVKYVKELNRVMVSIFIRMEINFKEYG